MVRTLFAASLLLLTTVALRAQTGIATNSPNGKPMSERVVAYDIDARLDTDKKTLDATETLTYRNLTGQPLTTFPFHLYLNAFRPESTFTAETRAGGGFRDSLGDAYPAEKIGGITVSHVDADGYGDLTATLHFTAPDDGNLADHTVAEITLPRPLAPNESVTFHLTFHDKFPLSVARNGYKRDFIMGGQWFPKVGVFWHGAWNCHQYHATTEFFSDFGTFNVRLTVPRSYTVGASGVPTGNQPNSDGTKTLSFYGEDIHDFAFAASPHFVVSDAIYLSSLGPVQIHVLALAAHPRIAQRYLDITRGALGEFERRYGPYPYKVITVVDPEPDAEMEGMEYPTLFTADGSWTGIFKVAELTAEHEFGHQYWYGMVASNEFEEAWLDEGINTYSEVKVLAALLGAGTSAVRERYANLGDGALQRSAYLTAPDTDPVTRFAWKFRNEQSYGAVTYGKTATLLMTLEGIVGKDTMDEAMRTYFERYRFTHPTTEDFLRTIEQVAVARGKATVLTRSQVAPADSTLPCIPVEAHPSNRGSLGTTTTFTQLSPFVPSEPSTGTAPPCTPSPASALPAASEPSYAPTSLRPFFNQSVYGTEMLDYAVDGFYSERVRWWEPVTRGVSKVPYLSTVSLRRKGDFIFPVTAEIVFNDGTRVREHWDGVDEWKRFTYTRTAKVVSVELDPDHLVPLDRDLFNNSITRDTDKIPAHKLAAIWAVLHQIAAQLVAWIV
ncbi:MAG TPA: M1 family metallopeptidase [Edaphobacter sp.]|nr:M1 family metallopeptidase [Edaphobacter sp.]